MVLMLMKSLAVLTPALAAFTVWWVKSAPKREEKRRKKRNAKIHNEVANRNASAIAESIAKLRAED